MAITEKECECGCGKKFHGTSRRKYFDNTCKNRQWRKDNKTVMSKHYKEKYIMTWLRDNNTKLNQPTVSNPVKAVVICQLKEEKNERNI